MRARTVALSRNRGRARAFGSHDLPVVVYSSRPVAIDSIFAAALVMHLVSILITHLPVPRIGQTRTA